MNKVESIPIDFVRVCLDNLSELDLMSSDEQFEWVLRFWDIFNKYNNKEKVRYVLTSVEYKPEDYYDDLHFEPSHFYKDEWKPVCPECGKDVYKSYKFCPYCGCELIFGEEPPLPKIDGSSYRELEKKKLDELSRVMEELNNIEDDES